MSLLAQHGYGKANKIDRALETDLVSGVVLSPKAESLDRLSDFSVEISRKYSNAKIYFDPQFYICGMQGDIVAGKLSEYPYYSPSLTRANLSAPQSLHDYTEKAISLQRSIPVSAIISPCIAFDNFDGRESQTAISLAYESIDQTSANQELFVSLCIHVNAFSNYPAMEDFLNVISLLDVKGFYIIIERANATDKPTAISESTLSNIMQFLYTLSTLNGFEIIMGYSDLISIPLSTVGNIDFACGWYNNLKMFSESSFHPSTGGRRPRKRYTSGVLMSSLLLVPEIATLNRLGISPRIASPSPFNSILFPNLYDADWTDEISCLHNWYTLNSILHETELQGSVSHKLDFIVDRIKAALQIYQEIDESGIPLEEKSNNSHLKIWLSAINNFRNQIGI